ncbi:MAG: right-handed parallel beta-helix repeat-containing protein [Thermoanaerobaculia bacterium]
MKKAVLAVIVTACIVADVRGERRRAIGIRAPIVVTTTIQAAVDAARSGDTIVVPAGVYPESILVSESGITIRALPGAIVDGAHASGSNGIIVRPVSGRIRDFKLTGLTIRNFPEIGVLIVSTDGFTVDDSTFQNNLKYGVFPIFSTAGQIDRNNVSGSGDTGIFIAESTDVEIDGNVVTDCTDGYDIENSSRVVMRNNIATANTLGITTEVLPQLRTKVGADVVIAGNTIVRNDRPNSVADPVDALAGLPSGIGILNRGTDGVTISDNLVTGNSTAGIVIASLSAAVATVDPAIDPRPDRNAVKGNILLDNGNQPDPRISPLTSSDLVWDLSGTSNCWSENEFTTATPSVLPACQ